MFDRLRDVSELEGIMWVSKLMRLHGIPDGEKDFGFITRPLEVLLTYRRKRQVVCHPGLQSIDLLLWIVCDSEREDATNLQSVAVRSRFLDMPACPPNVAS